jgi:hypothetical protein
LNDFYLNSHKKIYKSFAIIPGFFPKDMQFFNWHDAGQTGSLDNPIGAV